MLRFSAISLALAALAISAFAAFTTKSLGQSSAPVTIELFSDYQCPSCKGLHDQTVGPLIADYVRTGKVYLIHREFPLPMHQFSRLAASYAAAAYRIGKYEEVGNALFAHQAAWSVTGKVDEVVAGVLSAADMKKVRELAKQPAIEEEINYEIGLGRNANVDQTPTMIISHKGKKYPIKGTVTYSILRKFIDDLLKK
jgi:protein-disulfide isomerase